MITKQCGGIDIKCEIRNLFMRTNIVRLFGGCSTVMWTEGRLQYVFVQQLCNKIAIK